MNLGWTEILLLLGIALLLFGPSRLPGLGKSMGEAIRGFKKGITGQDETPPSRDVKEHLDQQSQTAKNQTEKENDKRRQ